jgi:hypothetical protein
MLDRVIWPITLGETRQRRDARDVIGVLKEYLQRFMQLLRRLIEAGGPLS